METKKQPENEPEMAPPLVEDFPHEEVVDDASSDRSVGNTDKGMSLGIKKGKKTVAKKQQADEKGPSALC